MKSAMQTSVCALRDSGGGSFRVWLALGNRQRNVERGHLLPAQAGGEAAWTDALAQRTTTHQGRGLRSASSAVASLREKGTFAASVDSRITRSLCTQIPSLLLTPRPSDGEDEPLRRKICPLDQHRPRCAMCCAWRSLCRA